MKALVVAYLGFLAALTWAQDGDAQNTGVRPEIRGVVLEAGTNRGVPEVGIILDVAQQSGQFIPIVSVGQTQTDAQGNFHLYPGRLGTFTVMAITTTQGHVGLMETITLNGAHPIRELQFTVRLVGELTGVVVDERTEEPAPNFSVRTMQRVYRNGQAQYNSAGAATTDEAGRFRIGGLTPGGYVVSLHGVHEEGIERVLPDVLKDADEVREISYWPGGRDLASAFPVTVDSGASVDVGTLKLRRVPGYRILVHVPAEACDPSFEIQVIEETTGRGDLFGNVTCGDFVMRGVQAGSYKFSLNGDLGPDKAGMRGITWFDVVDRNLEVTVPLHAGVDLAVRIIAAKDAGKPPFDKISVAAQGTPWDLARPRNTKPDSDGMFQLNNISWGQQQLAISGVDNSHYVQEVRYNGVTVSDNVITVNGPGSLEIVVDDKPAAITGRVSDGDRAVSQPEVFLVRWPASATDMFRSVTRTTGDEEGGFQFQGVAPGEYRILAVPRATADKLQEPYVLERLIKTAETIKVDPNGRQDLLLKPTDPLR